tara:strand:+ start:300 stop:821 length:522 start_codon:yes stop_codon:yes gene_type:complete
MEFTFLRSLKAYSILLLTGALLFTTGCEDDDHDHDEEHTDADGFVLEHDGTEHYRQFQGVVTTPDGSGALTVTVDGDLELSVHFLDDDGHEIEHSEEEGEEDHEDGLEVTVADESVAHVEVEGHDEEGGDDHGMAIHVEGVSVGSTTFTLALMHDGHSDFTSLPVTVNVVAGQ